MNDNAKKWIKALRSGDYPQSKGALHRVMKLSNKDQVGYCCLGVACEVFNKENPDDPLSVTDGPDGLRYYDGDHWYLPERVMYWLGVDKEATFEPSKEQASQFLDEAREKVSASAQLEGQFNLPTLNDTLGYDFNKIADVIEADPEGMFSNG